MLCKGIPQQQSGFWVQDGAQASNSKALDDQRAEAQEMQDTLTRQLLASQATTSRLQVRYPPLLPISIPNLVPIDFELFDTPLFPSILLAARLHTSPFLASPLTIHFLSCEMHLCGLPHSES